MRRRILILLTAFFLAIFFACEPEEGPQGPKGERGEQGIGEKGKKGDEGEQGPPGPIYIYIAGAVEAGNPDSPSWPNGFAYVNALYSLDIPVMKINGVDLGNPKFPMYYESNKIPVQKGDSAHLEVSYTKLDSTEGLAKADIKMLGDFEITSQKSIELAAGEGFETTWSSSEGTENYVVSGNIWYSYQDSSGVDGSYSISVDTLLSSTSIVFSVNYLYPKDLKVKSINASNGNLDVYAVSKLLKKGSTGNVYEDGRGFFVPSSIYAGNVKIGSNTKSSLREINSSKDPVKEFLEKKMQEVENSY